MLLTSVSNLRALPRRGFLRILLALSALLPAHFLLAAPGEEAKRRVSVRALGPYLDTLIPQDSTPSATQLGVDKALITDAREHRRFARLIALGCAWLDKRAVDLGAEEFSALDEAARELLVARAERSPRKSLAQQFFLHTQARAFFHYYAQTAAWQGLGYAGPPQPVGFPDQAKPPKDSLAWRSPAQS
jgi:hypothetical protein